MRLNLLTSRLDFFNCRFTLITCGIDDPFGLLLIRFFMTNFEIIIFIYLFNTIKMIRTKVINVKIRLGVGVVICVQVNHSNVLYVIRL